MFKQYNSRCEFSVRRSRGEGGSKPLLVLEKSAPRHQQRTFTKKKKTTKYIDRVCHIFFLIHLRHLLCTATGWENLFASICFPLLQYCIVAVEFVLLLFTLNKNKVLNGIHIRNTVRWWSAIIRPLWQIRHGLTNSIQMRIHYVKRDRLIQPRVIVVR
jgi:hypothetical protein